MFHLADISKFNQCPYRYLYSTNKEEGSFMTTFLRMDESFNSLMMKKLKMEDPFVGYVGDSMEKSLKAMEEKEWLIRARFAYRDLRINIPAMHKNEGKWDIYFGRPELFPTEDEAQYLADELYVLKKLNIEVGEIYYLHFDKEYMRLEELDYDAVLKCSTCFYNSKGRASVSLKESIENHMRDLDAEIDKLEAFDPENLPEKVRDSRCTRHYKCAYYQKCWPNEKEVEDDSILHLVGSRYKYQMNEEGLTSLKDADPERIEGSKQQYAQIMADRNGGLFVDKNALRSYMKDTIKFPLSFIDFEWDTYGVPPFEKMHPFDVSLFQYSLHILDSEDSELRHEEYIGFRDCRRELLLDLLDELPEEGSILTFNGIGAEEIRMRELAELYPEYADQIQRVVERMVDISIPFVSGVVYHTKMAGLYSLKQIVEIFGEDASYHNLEIGKAVNAVFEWRKLEALDSLEDQEENIKDLLAYCGMDTYSLYLIYKWFKTLVEEDD